MVHKRETKPMEALGIPNGGRGKKNEMKERQKKEENWGKRSGLEKAKTEK